MKIRVTLLLVLGLAMTTLPAMAATIYDDGPPFGFAGVPIGQGAANQNYATSDTVQCAGPCTPTDITFYTVTPEGQVPSGSVLWNFASGPNMGVGYNSGTSTIPNALACQDNGIAELCLVQIQLAMTTNQPAFSWLTLRGLTGNVNWAFSGTGSSQAQLCITNGAGVCGPTLPDISPEAFSVSGTVVPEPGSIMLLGSGLIGVAGILRRRMR